MKKIIAALVFVFGLALVLPTIGGAEEMFIDSKTFTKMAPAGVSYWVCDLRDRKSDGFFTISVIGVTQSGGGSGTTLTFDYTSTNEKPSAAQIAGTAAFQFLDWTRVTSFVVDTGNTQYPYTVEPQNTKFFVTRWTAGVTGPAFDAELVGR